MIFQNVFIVGATGKVGRTLVQQIFQEGDDNPGKHVHPTRVVGVASSTHYLFSLNGLPNEKCVYFSNRQSQAFQYGSLDEILQLPDIKNGNSPITFVDATDERNIASFHLHIVEQTRHSMVTANKNPLTLTDYETFRRLTRQSWRYDYRCSVMAGADAVVKIRDLLDVNDAPKRIEGCFSGTIGHVSTEIEGRLFSEALADAKDKGYTEPDPRDDMNGLDVKRKLLTLARTAGYRVELSDVQAEPFIPKEFFKEESIEDFMHSARQLDPYFSELVRKASEAGNVLRYVAKMDATSGHPALTVSLQEVPKASQLGALRGRLNKIIIVSSTYHATDPYSVEAPGAGLDVTAQNIRVALANMVNERQFRE